MNEGKFEVLSVIVMLGIGVVAGLVLYPVSYLVAYGFGAGDDASAWARGIWIALAVGLPLWAVVAQVNEIEQYREKQARMAREERRRREEAERQKRIQAEARVRNEEEMAQRLKSQAEEQARLRKEAAETSARLRKEAAETSARLRKEAAETSARRQREEWARLATELPVQTVSLYGLAVDCAMNASFALERAKQHRAARAFTPFWESLEQGLIALNDHRVALEAAAQCAVQYRVAVDSLAKTSGPRVPVVSFPSNEMRAGAVDAGSLVAAAFEKLTYTAHSDYQFASIYEQRRTTAAVIAGFGSLNDAVDRMRGTITKSFQDLSATVVSVSRERWQASSYVAPQVITSDLDRSIMWSTSDSLGGQVVAMNRQLETIAKSLRR